MARNEPEPVIDGDVRCYGEASRQKDKMGVVLAADGQMLAA